MSLWLWFMTLRREWSRRSNWTALERQCFCRRVTNYPDTTGLVREVLGFKGAERFYNGMVYMEHSVEMFLYNKQVERNKTCVEVAMHLAVLSFKEGRSGFIPIALMSRIIPFMKGPRTYLALNLFTTLRRCN